MPVFEGVQWSAASGTTTVTWSFAANNYNLGSSYNGYVSFDSPIGDYYRAGVRMAFAAWSAVANINFVEVADSASADIRIGNRYIDGSPAYGGSVLAETQYWAHGSALAAAEIYFDTDAYNGSNFYETAEHEIGHALGLAHSATPSNVMYFQTNSANTSGVLTADDISGVQSLYGARSSSAVVTSSNLTFTSTAANETFVGQGGNDTVIYQGSLKGYVLTRNGSAITVTDGTSGRDGIDNLTNIQHVQFSDFSVNTTAASTAALVPKGTLDSIVELYAAYFNRVPTASGLTYWVNQVAGGESLTQVAKDFYAAGLQFSQYTGYTATTTNTDFIRLVYSNVLARSGATAPSAGELTYWNGLLQSGAIARPDLIASMLNSAHAFANDPTWGWVSKLLDNKVAFGEYVAAWRGIDYLSTGQEFSQSGALLAQVTPTGYSNAISALGIDQNVLI